MDTLPAVPPAEPRQRWRLTYARSSEAQAVGARDQLLAWEAAVVSTGLPAAGLDAHPARPRIVLGAPIPAGLAAERELADLFLTVRMPVADVRSALDPHMPPRHELVDLADVWLGEPPLPGQVAGADYRGRAVRGDAAPLDAATVADAARGLLAATTLPRTRRKGDREVEYDLRPLLSRIATPEAVTDDVVMLRFRVRHDPERGVGRPDEVLAALGERIGVDLAFAEIVRERLVLGSDD